MAYIDIVINRGIRVLENAEFRAMGRTMSSRASTICDLIKDHIGDAEEQQLNQPGVEEWMERIKYLSYDLVDVWEELNLKKELAKKNAAASCLVLPCYSLGSIRGFEMELEGIIHGFEAIASDASKLGLRRGWEPSIPREIMEPRRLPKTSSLSDEDHINLHGRDSETRILISKLLKDDFSVGLMAQMASMVFISIVGENGIGKTALAQHVFNDREVQRHFDHWAWVSVSGKFNLRQIVKDIIRSLTSAPVRDVEMEALELRFRQVIEGKILLLVLDDVRNDEHPSWQGLSSLLKPCQFGSMVLLTTPVKAVALIARTDPINMIHLEGLSEQACWSIIKDTAFGNSVDESKIERLFNEVGRDAASKCGGVPLAARAIGNILRGRESIEEWRTVLRGLWNLQGRDGFRAALMLNYSLLPPVLRQCLSYCSIFPKNYLIDVDKLIKLWMAQGFVDPDQDEMERESRERANQLLDRNFFQEFKKDGNCNLKCKLEDAMVDFIRSLPQNECHLMQVDSEKDMEKEAGENHAPKQTRHCTLNIVDQTPLTEKIEHANKLHTLMILSEDSNVDATDLARLLRHMRRVRAIDLSSCSINALPTEVGRLLHLRYLDLSFCRDLKKLPDAICNLLNLQTLNLNGCDSLRKLPKSIGELAKLRHLEILWTTSLSYLPKGVASLTALRTLNRFFGSSGAASTACNLGDLENLNYLRGCITIDGLGGETDVGEAARAGLENKINLLGLELWFSIVGSEITDQGILEALRAPPQLQCLGIFCYGGKSFPHWVTELDRLTRLFLADCCNCDTLPLLGRLSSLESLELKNLAKVKQVDSLFLVTGTESESLKVVFPKLEKLCFQKLENWETWSDLGDRRPYMPKLTFLSIESCPKLKALPNYITRKTGKKIYGPLKEEKILWEDDNEGEIELDSYEYEYSE